MIDAKSRIHVAIAASPTALAMPAFEVITPINTAVFRAVDVADGAGGWGAVTGVSCW